MYTRRMNKQSDKELVELGRKLQDFYETGYINKKQALYFSFLKGMATGVGAFMGGTLVVAILLGLLSLFTDIPLLGNLIEMIQKALAKSD